MIEDNPLAAGLAQPSQIEKPTGLEAVREGASINLERTSRIEHRLGILLDRIQGPRPTASGADKQPPADGLIADIYNLNTETAQSLDRIDSIVDDLERLL